MIDSEPAATFPNFAQDVRRRVDQRLAKIFSDRCQHLSGLDAKLPLLGGAVGDVSLRGGKRLRSVLVASDEENVQARRETP
jgi:hypothetical protein